MEQLPIEIVDKILHFIKNPQSLVSLAQTCRKMHQHIANHETIWQRVFPIVLRNFGPDDKHPTLVAKAEQLLRPYTCYLCSTESKGIQSKHVFYDHLRLCTTCKHTPFFNVIAKTHACAKYLLNPDHLDDLDVRFLTNPHYKNAAPMQLYLEREVRELSDAYFASMNTTRDQYILNQQEQKKEREERAEEKAKHRQDVLLPRRRILRRAQLISFGDDMSLLMTLFDRTATHELSDTHPPVLEKDVQRAIEWILEHHHIPQQVMVDDLRAKFATNKAHWHDIKQLAFEFELDPKVAWEHYVEVWGGTGYKDHYCMLTTMYRITPEPSVETRRRIKNKMLLQCDSDFDAILNDDDPIFCHIRSMLGSSTIFCDSKNLPSFYDIQQVQDTLRHLKKVRGHFFEYAFLSRVTDPSPDAIWSQWLIAEPHNIIDSGWSIRFQLWKHVKDSHVREDLRRRAIESVDLDQSTAVYDEIHSTTLVLKKMFPDYFDEAIFPHVDQINEVIQAANDVMVAFKHFDRICPKDMQNWEKWQSVVLEGKKNEVIASQLRVLTSTLIPKEDLKAWVIQQLGPQKMDRFTNIDTNDYLWFLKPQLQQVFEESKDSVLEFKKLDDVAKKFETMIKHRDIPLETWREWLMYHYPNIESTIENGVETLLREKRKLEANYKHEIKKLLTHKNPPIQCPKCQNTGSPSCIMKACAKCCSDLNCKRHRKSHAGKQ